MDSIWTWVWGVLMLALMFLVTGGLLFAGAMAMRCFIERRKAREAGAGRSEEKKKAA